VHNTRPGKTAHQNNAIPDPFQIVTQVLEPNSAGQLVTDAEPVGYFSHGQPG